MTTVAPRKYQQLIAWKESKELTLKIYAVTKLLPQEERFHIVTQLRRAASSIMANLAEGSAMSTKAHRRLFYMRARGSTVEVDNFIELCFALKYIDNTTYDDLFNHTGRLSFLITKLMK